MSDLTNFQGGPAVTMTSREIAELTGKRHDNVMADIRAMLVELHGERGVLSFQDTHLNQQNGQTYPIFKLPKRETLILVSGYNLQMRAKIIDRWQQLEESPAAWGLPNFLDPAAAALAWAEQVQAKQALQAENAVQARQLALAAPKVEFADAVADAANCQTVEEVAKVLGTGRNRLYQSLRAQRILRSNNLPYQDALDAGHFKVIERIRYDRNGEPVTYLTTLVTGKGLAFIQKRLASVSVSPQFQGQLQ